MNVTFEYGTDLNKEIAKLNEDAGLSNQTEEDLQFPEQLYKSLPKPMKKAFEVIGIGQRRDIALLSVLIILSNIIRKAFTIYDNKKEGCQLYCYVVSDPGQGKGFAASFRDVGLKYHKHLQKEFYDKLADLKSSTEDDVEKPARRVLFTSGNITKAALSKELADNDGFGVFYETEADTLASANSSDHGAFKDILKKGFHGENYSVNKVYLDEPLEIDHVRLSVFITSTFNQCLKLIPNYEDGLFSRFIFYVLLPKGYRNVFKQDNKYAVIKHQIEKLADLAFEVAINQDNLAEVEFMLTSSQGDSLFTLMSEYETSLKNTTELVKAGGINRLSQIAVRLCMILTYIEHWEHVKAQQAKKLVCSSKTFNAVISLLEVLKKHMVTIDALYSRHSRQYKNQILIKGGSKNQGIIQECLRLRSEGRSVRDISRIVFGNENHLGTVSRWVKKYSNIPFPFRETETPITVDTKELLRLSRVNYYDDLYKVSDSTKALWYIANITETMGYNDRQVEKIRNLDNKNLKLIESKRLPHFNPQGIIDEEGQNIASYANCIVLFIKAGKNKHIDNFSQLKAELANIINVAYCGKTVLGDYVVFIGIDNPELHSHYFYSVKKVFEAKGIVVEETSGAVPVPSDTKPYLSSKCLLIKTEIHKD